MQRRFSGIMLVLLAAWMCALTIMIIYRPDLFLGEIATGEESASSDQKGSKKAVDLTADAKGVGEEKEKENKAAETSILVAARDLKWDQIERIQADMLTVLSLPTYLLPDGYITAELQPDGKIQAAQLEDIAGQILMVDLYEGEPLLQYKLHRNQERLIEDRTALNQRAMAVKVDEVVGVAGFIKPYSRVDVLVTLLKRKPPETRTVLRNVLVLATGIRGDRVASPSSPDRGSSSLPDRVASSLGTDQSQGEKQAPMNVSVVTLQVSPGQAEKLALASSEGKLRLVLRNPRDKEPGKTQGITLTSLLSEGKPPRRRANKVVVIKGSKVEAQYFNQ